MLMMWQKPFSLIWCGVQVRVAHRLVSAETILCDLFCIGVKMIYEKSLRDVKSNHLKIPATMILVLCGTVCVMKFFPFFPMWPNVMSSSLFLDPHVRYTPTTNTCLPMQQVCGRPPMPTRVISLHLMTCCKFMPCGHGLVDIHHLMKRWDASLTLLITGLHALKFLAIAQFGVRVP